MVVGGGAIVSDVNNIMGGMESTSGVKLHNHRRKLRQRFDLVRKLGQGTYGKVQLGINKETGQEVAIKTIKKAKIETEADLIRIRREIQIMSSVRHPNIIHIYEVFENKEKMVLVMEYAAGGELYDYLSERKVLNEVEARRVFRQVASAVYYCHKHKICHRDLKLENILLDETKNAKIADFGLSNVFDDRSLLTTFCGSPLYASPEIVRGTPYLGPEVDCWSLGVLLYTLVYGAMPFDGSNFKRLVKQISSGEYYEPKKPSSASPLIRHMLTVEPSKRATVEDICSHWWVNEGYAESCLEVAEDLANQTPVRLDLLISLMPPPTNSDAVMIGKLDSSMTSPPASAANDVECDSMNEYYSAHSNTANANEPVQEESASPSKKSKKKKEKDGSSKRKREEANIQEATVHKKQETTESKEPVEDKRREEEKFQPPQSAAECQAGAKKLESSEDLAADQLSSPAPKEDVSAHDDNMEVDEGVSTSSSWTAANFDANLREKIAGLVEPETSSNVTDKEPSIPPLSPVELKEEPLIKTSHLDTVPQESSKTSNDESPINEKEIAKDKEEQIPEQQPESLKASEPIIQESEIQKDSAIQESLIQKDSAIQPQEKPETNEPQRCDINLETTPRDRRNSADEPRTVAPGVGSSATLEKRNSKILRQAEVFNSLMGSKTEPRTMTLERPKKVTIYGFKVSDTRRMYEAKPELKKPAVVPALKVSDAKRAFEISAATARPASVSYSTLPRRTLIQTPSTGNSNSPQSRKETRQNSVGSSSQSQRSSTAEDDPNERVIVGGLGVKIGAVGKVTEIGMKVQTEDSNKQKPTSSKTSNSKSVDQTLELKPKDTVQPKDLSSATAVLDISKTSAVEPVKAAEPSSCPEVPAAPKVDKHEEAKAKKLKSPNLKLFISPAVKPEENKEIDVVLDTGAAEPKMAAMLISGSTTAHGQNSKETVTPPPRPFSPPGQTKAAAPPSVPPKPAKPSAAAKVSSPPPCGVRTLERREKFERAADKEVEEPIVAGSENMFLRSLRSPGREPQEPKKRTSKVQTESAEATVTIPAADPPRFKTEISGNVAAAPPQINDSAACPSFQQVDYNPAPNLRTESSIPVIGKLMTTATTANTPLQKQQSLKERIIPIEIEGRTEPVAKPLLSSQNPANSSSSTLTRLTSPPPPSKATTASRQESVRSPTPSDTESLRIREPIRKSPREFIIPISVEGGGFVTPKETMSNPPVFPSRSAQQTARPKSSRLDRTRRFGGFFNDFASESEDSNTSAMQSPAHTLQRLSSFGKGYADIKLDEQKRMSELQRSGSGSSGDDDDDDDTFQILTAESLFSTLLSRVRQLTRRSNRESMDPFGGSVRSSRYTSPAPSTRSTGTTERNGPKYSSSVNCNQPDQPDIQSPASSSVTTASVREGSLNGNRNGFFAETASQEPKGPWTTLYSRPSSVASDSTSRRYSTLDSPRHGLNREDWSSSMPWRNKSISRDTSDTESVYSTPANATLPRVRWSTYSVPAAPKARVSLSLHVSPGRRSNEPAHYVTTRTSYIGPTSSGISETATSNLDGAYPFTSSLTRRVLNQHLRETNPELIQQQQYNRSSRLTTEESSDAHSDVSSTSDGTRSSLSWALSRLSSVLGDPAVNQSRKEYGRTHSSRELGSNTSEGRKYQRYGRASTLDSINNHNSIGRLGSPTNQSDDETASQGTAASYRTYTRTCSREYLSPGSSRGTSPTPALPVNNLAPQLSTVLENSHEGETTRSERRIPIAVISNTSDVVSNLNSTEKVPREEEQQQQRRSQRVSRFLRPDFFEPQKEVAEPNVVPPATKLNDPEEAKQKFLKMVEKRWEKFRSEEAKNEEKQNASGPDYRITELRRISPEEAAEIKTNPKKNEPRIVIEVRIGEGKSPKQRTEENRQSEAKGPAEMLKIQREQLSSFDHKPSVQHQQQQLQENVPKPLLKHVDQPNGKQKPVKPESNHKSSPKLNVRRQFEHLLNLAAAQFQRSQSPAKASSSASKNSSQQENVSSEPQENVAKNGQSSMKPAVPVKPEHLVTANKSARPVQENSIPANGSNPKELSRLSCIAISDELTAKPNDMNIQDEGNSNGGVKFAKIKRLEAAAENSIIDYPEDIPGTPTDSYESSSVCSDLRDRELRDMGDEESVSERIHRKSFYSRFNDSTKAKSKHRRSSTKELPDLSNASSTSLASPPPNSSVLPPRLPTKHHRSSSRDETAEALMVRKFLSRPSDVESSTIERERRLSVTRRQASNTGEADSESRKSFSRESSVVRNTPTSPVPDVTSPGRERESRAYFRTPSQRQLPADVLTKPAADYSTNSLNRRSYYASSSDNTSSLPRRMNRYSTYETDNNRSSAGVASNSFSTTPYRSSLSAQSSSNSSNNNSSSVTASNRSSFSPTSRYSAILEESSSSPWSPGSGRRTSGLPETLTGLTSRRETSFYGTPSSRDSSLSRRGEGSSNYFLRSTSSGLDYPPNSSTSNNTTSYATIRPTSYLRHRR